MMAQRSVSKQNKAAVGSAAKERLYDRAKECIGEADGNMREAAAAIAEAIKKLPQKAKVPDARYSPYVPRLLDDLLAKWK